MLLFPWATFHFPALTPSPSSHTLCDVSRASTTITTTPSTAHSQAHVSRTYSCSPSPIPSASLLPSHTLASRSSRLEVKR